MIWVGTETSGAGGQVLEIVLVVTNENLGIKAISPTYVIKRDIDKSIDVSKYQQYSQNGLLDEADHSWRKESSVEDYLVECLPPKHETTPTVYFCAADRGVLQLRMPSLMKRLLGRPIYLDTAMALHPHKLNCFSQPGRALEDTVQAIGQVKRLVIPR